MPVSFISCETDPFVRLFAARCETPKDTFEGWQRHGHKLSLSNSCDLDLSYRLFQSRPQVPTEAAAHLDRRQLVS